MKGVRGWVLAAMLSLAIAAVAYLFQPHQDSPEHSSTSDAANGTSAAVLFAQAMGHPTHEITGAFTPPAAGGLMFVFTPTSPYTPDEAAQTASWVHQGGVLVYAAEHGDPELDRALGVSRAAGIVQSTNAIANPVLAGVSEVAGGSFATPLAPAVEQVPILRTSGGSVLGYLAPFGTGRVVVLADPLVLCNGYLDKKDNGRLLADILGTFGAGAPVAFDEYHHGLTLTDLSPQAWLLTPWGAALVWLLIAVFAGLLLRGRGFGPLIGRPAEAPRGDVEWATAVGELLRRSGARDLTLRLLATASERAVAARTGLPLQPRERFWSALWVRAPELASELADAEQSLYAPRAGDAELMRAAQRLHDVAYPRTPEHPPVRASASKEA
ncbi:MAG: DUF4350 domain-containing protein [Candidatus Dormibacteraeota bacterium]|nr:DUF4350 domain-containing protein [Candidatus Dormibacteraeota bacterium]